MPSLPCTRCHAASFHAPDAPHGFANANASPPSACHCKTRPCTRSHAATFCMSLRTSAHTGAAIRSPRRGAWQVGTASGKSVALFRIRPKYRFLLCPAARRTDCHVASLLAMTVGRCHRAPCPHSPAPLPRSKFPRTRRAPRPCTREHLPAFCPSLRPCKRRSVPAFCMSLQNTPLHT